MGLQETYSVTEIQRLCEVTDYLDASDIRANDKTISWDGSIIYFEDTKPQKAGNEYKIPVQIKGKSFRTLPKQDILSYPVSMKDLNNYFRDGGAIFFVVAIEEKTNAVKPYAKVLLPVDIKHLKMGKNEQKTISVQFAYVSSSVELLRLCDMFAKNRMKQSILITNSVDSLIEDATSFTFSGIPLDSTLPPEVAVIKSKHKYMYAKKDGIEIPMVVSGLMMGHDDQWKIEIGDIYSELLSIKRIISENETKILILGIIEVVFPDSVPNKVTFNYKDCSNVRLQKACRIAELIIAASKEDCLTINGVPLFQSGKNPLPQKLPKRFVQLFEDILAMKELVVGLNIDPNIFTVNEVFEAESDLRLLKHALIDGDAVRLDNAGDKGMYFQQVGCKKMPLTFLKKEDGKYVLKGLLDEGVNAEFRNTATSPPTVISKWFILPKGEIRNTIFDKARMIEDMQNTSNEHDFVELNFFVLSLIHEFDISKDKTLLIFAEKLNNILVSKEAEAEVAVAVINDAQIKRRMNKFSEEDEKRILEMKTRAKDKALICCACILLKQFDEFYLHLESFTESEHETFFAWPIVALLPETK